MLLQRGVPNYGSLQLSDAAGGELVPDARQLGRDGGEAGELIAAAGAGNPKAIVSPAA